MKPRAIYVLARKDLAILFHQDSGHYRGALAAVEGTPLPDDAELIDARVDGYGDVLVKFAHESFPTVAEGGIIPRLGRLAVTQVSEW